MEHHRCEHCHHHDHHKEHHEHEHHHSHEEHHSGHDHHVHHEEEFKKRFIVSFLLTLPVVALAGPFPLVEIPYSHYIVLLLSTIVFFYGGKPFFEGALHELKNRSPGMMTLVSFAVISAYVYSLFGGNFFWELTTLITVMLLGHWIESRSVSHAMRELHILKEIIPSRVHVVHHDHILDVDISQVKRGDVVVVKVGERVPVDGVIIEGRSSFDTSVITGESRPVEKGEGDRVVGGELNLESVIKIRVEAVGDESYLGYIQKLIDESLRSRTRIQRLADRFAAILFYIALFSGIGAFIYWYPIKGLTFAIERMISVFVISCPHALGLAIPLVVSLSTSRLARQGVILRDRKALEITPKVEYILLDKTGTLTKGKPKVEGDDNTLTYAASVEQFSEHVIGKAIVEEARKRGLKLYDAKNVEVIPGKGIKGKVDGKEVFVGRGDKPDEIVVMVGGKKIGALKIVDELRDDAKEIIAHLREKGYKVFIVSGDSERITREVAEELGADGYFAEVLPHEKQKIVKQMKEKGKVMMVGDGINDAPALAEADVGVAVASGTELAVYTSHVIIKELKSLLSLIEISKRSLRRMYENLFWAAGYNVIAIPAAMGLIEGIIITPAVAALIMSLSTVIVAFNSLRI